MFNKKRKGIKATNITNVTNFHFAFQNEVILLTTDYQDRTPTAIDGIKVENDKLTWQACQDEEHTYYRVYKDGKQIASTVAEYLAITDQNAKYEVRSVDKYGNCAK